MFWQAKHSHTSFAKRGTMQHFFPLRPAEFEAGHHMHMLSPTPRPNFENGALHAYIFSYAQSNLETGRYLQIFFPTPQSKFGKRGATCKYLLLRPGWILGGELHAKFISYAPMQSESNVFHINLLLPQLYFE